jgi:hypothetical protein
MENKIIVLTKDEKWIELKNCIVVGAVEYPDKVVYHRYLFSDCQDETRIGMIERAEKYANEMKREIP